MKVSKLKEPGRYSDGGGLHLLIDKTGHQRWVLRYSFHGKRHDMGLGPLREVGLSEARESALQARRNIREGKDPILSRRHNRETPLFGDYATELHNKIKSQWKNELSFPLITDPRILYFSTKMVRFCDGEEAF